MDFYCIASGSSGNCVYIGSDRASVLVDSGISYKRTKEALYSIGRGIEDLTGILITHEHTDHISGLGVLTRKTHVPIYGTEATLLRVMRNPCLKNVDTSLFHFIEAGKKFRVGDLNVSAVRISHDAADPVSYRIESGTKAVAVATDMGMYTQSVIDHLQGLDAVLIEANHDENMLELGPYPYPLKRRIMGEKGHLSNCEAGNLLTEILNDHMKKVYLGHLSKINNYGLLAYATVVARIAQSENCPYKEGDIPIEVASADHPMDMLTI